MNLSTEVRQEEVQEQAIEELRERLAHLESRTLSPEKVLEICYSIIEEELALRLGSAA